MLHIVALLIPFSSLVVCQVSSALTIPKKHNEDFFQSLVHAERHFSLAFPKELSDDSWCA